MIANVQSAPTPTPTARTSRILLAAYAFAYLGIWMATLTPLLVSLPMRIRQIDPRNYFNDLSLILSLGALLAMIANPFFGKLSDRTTSRFGMRRPWLVAGSGAGIAGVLLMALTPSVLAIGAGWCLTQLAMNILLAVTTAILPDQIPAAERGRVSGMLSMCMSAAPTLGAMMVRQFLESSLWMFLAPGLIMAAGSLALSAILNDRHLQAGEVSPYTVKEFLSSFWVDWLAYPEFSWLWISRFMRFISLAILHSYQVYYITDHLGKGTAWVASMMVVASLISAVAGVLGANATGVLIDCTHRRKLFVLLGALVYAAGMFLLAFTCSTPSYFAALGICGFAQGIFIASDFALVTDVLPESGRNAAKNMGVFNIANALPQSIAPAFAPLLLTLGGVPNNYMALFAASGIASLLSAALILMIRRVR